MLKIRTATKTFKTPTGTATALDRVDLDVAEGELLVLLGPSGCGKTTLLRCIAGFESPDAGSITFGERPFYNAASGVNLPSERRDIGMVFQSYALWPHMTVRRNIAFPLKVRKMKKLLADGGVENAANVVDCGNLLDRLPSQLSGGQQQRVALARGIVTNPALVLMDEPLSNLDALLRVQVRRELHRLHNELGFTGVYVTHDQDEALAIGDRIAIMRAGQIDSMGTPQEVYQRPKTDYSADFVGFTNFLDVTRGGSGAWQTAGAHQVYLDESVVPTGVDSARLRFRPQAGAFDLDVSGESRNIGLSFKAVVRDVVYAGDTNQVTLLLDEREIIVSVPVESQSIPDRGANVVVTVSRDSIFAFDARNLGD